MQKNVIEYLVKTVKAFPDKKAVCDAEMSITFGELWTNASRLATAIYALDLKNAPMGVYMAKGCKMVEAFAAINMSGSFYVPLDT